MHGATTVEEVERRLEQDASAERIRVLFGALRASGLVLVLPPANQTASVHDVVDALREAVEHYSRMQGLSARASNLMRRYLSDHLGECVDGSIKKVIVCQDSMKRTPDIK